jgi:hypothetical protein
MLFLSDIAFTNAKGTVGFRNEAGNWSGDAPFTAAIRA